MIRLIDGYNRRIELDTETNHFPDGTLRITSGYAEYPCIEWFYESDAELFHVIALRSHYSGVKMDLFLPYIPNARMDRVKNPKEVFTLKAFADTINWLGFHRVYVLDAHSAVSLALINNVREFTPEKFIFKATHEIAFMETHEVGHEYYEKAMDDLTFFYPDEGAMKRYSTIFKHPYAFGNKNRDWETGHILGLDIVHGERVKDKNILIVDDICSAGGTFLHSAKALKDLGAKNIYLYITHAEATIYKGEMYNTPGLVKYIFTTNSIAKAEGDNLKKTTIFDIDWEEM